MRRLLNATGRVVLVKKIKPNTDNGPGMGILARMAIVGVAGAGFAAMGADAIHARTPNKKYERDVPSISELRDRVARTPRRERKLSASQIVNREVGRMQRLNRLFVEVGARHNVDPRLLYSICKKESSFRSHLTSPVGAQGLMQFMPGTARRFKINAWVDEQAIDGAARYLKFLLGKFDGDMAAAVAAYNAGETAVAGWREGFSFRNAKGRLMNSRKIRTANGLPPYRETQEYVRVVSMTWRNTDWVSQFGPEVASRLGSPRFSEPRGGARSEVARAARESVVEGAAVAEVQPATATVAAAKPSPERASRFYDNAPVVAAEALPATPVPAADAAVVVGAPAAPASGDAARSSAEGVAAVVGAQASPGEVNGSAFVDPFSGVRFVQGGTPSDQPAVKLAVSRTSVYLGGE